jgi:hypothetical protein
LTQRIFLQKLFDPSVNSILIDADPVSAVVERNCLNRALSCAIFDIIRGREKAWDSAKIAHETESTGYGTVPPLDAFTDHAFENKAIWSTNQFANAQIQRYFHGSNDRKIYQLRNEDLSGERGANGEFEEYFSSVFRPRLRPPPLGAQN